MQSGAESDGTVEKSEKANSQPVAAGHGQSPEFPSQDTTAESWPSAMKNRQAPRQGLEPWTSGLTVACVSGKPDARSSLRVSRYKEFSQTKGRHEASYFTVLSTVFNGFHTRYGIILDRAFEIIETFTHFAAALSNSRHR
jgi:hypothetical protein